MKKPLKVRIGTVLCLNCLAKGKRTEVPLRRNEATAALSFSCHECELPGYVKDHGSEAYNDVLARRLPDNTSQDVPKPTAPAPAATSSKTIFG